MIDLAVKLVLALFVFFGVLNLAALHTWLERKQSALMQDRIGANRASILGWRLMGLFHPLADSIKMFTKEDIVPAGADRILHTLAPVFSVFFALVTFAAIPFGDRFLLGGHVIELQVAKINVALLYIFAMLSLGVYGVSVITAITARTSVGWGTSEPEVTTRVQTTHPTMSAIARKPRGRASARARSRTAPVVFSFRSVAPCRRDRPTSVSPVHSPYPVSRSKKLPVKCPFW